MSKIRDDIIWISCFIESEGWIGTEGKHCPAIKLCSIDLDVVEHAARILKRKVRTAKSRNPKYKLAYTVYIFGSPAVEFLFSIFSLMGKRRKESIKQTIHKWKAGRKLQFSPQQISYIRQQHKQGTRNIDIARELNADPSDISRIVTGKTYKKW